MSTTDWEVCKCLSGEGLCKRSCEGQEAHPVKIRGKCIPGEETARAKFQGSSSLIRFMKWKETNVAGVERARG